MGQNEPLSSTDAGKSHHPILNYRNRSVAGAVHPNSLLTVYFADKPIFDNMMRSTVIKNSSLQSSSESDTNELLLTRYKHVS